jgi:hypothetical protein
MFRSAGWMMSSPYVSRAALEAGVPARYLYWQGRSGRRYLFTCMGPGAIGDFEEAVAIAVSDGRIIWSGEVSALARLPGDAPPRRAAIYVHLLAANLAERRVVIEDFRPAEEVHLRLAA